MFLTLAVVVCCLAANAQDKVIHDPNAQVRSVTTFHGIHVATGIHLYLTQSTENKVVVSASDVEVRDRIVTEVKNGILHIYYDHSGFEWRDLSGKNMNVYVSCTTLDELEANSGSHVMVDGTIKSANLAFDFSSGAHFTGKVETSDLKVDESSGAHSDISGTAGHVKAETSSGAALNGYDLHADICDASASSGGHIYISVEKEMSVSAHSGGHIRYQGAGVIREVNTSSGGSVSRN